MIEAIKTRLWGLLRGKDVSLAMLYDRGGHIAWTRGRTVRGKTIDEGSGFPKTPVRSTLDEGKGLEQDDVVSLSGDEDLPESARVLYLRSVLILPVGNDYFLYVDSGSKEAFSEADREVIKVMGGLLGESIARIARSDADRAGIAGTSAAMARVRNLVVRYALEEEPVLLLGETGVGKTHLADLIHRYSGRRGRLVCAHVPSIPESLFERELFGHARGAFTGADRAAPGLVQEAEGGTLLLDEISEVPPTCQAKLLELAETRSYRPVGDSRERRAEVRLLAASNRNLAEEVEAGRFRRDLYYRLGVLPITIPPLRDRPEDLRALVEQHRDLLRGKRPAPGFWEALERHDWPGNVRELLQVLKRVGIQLEGPTVGGEVADLIGGSAAEADRGTGTRVDAVEAALQSGESFWEAAWRPFLDRDLNRSELRGLLARWYTGHGHSLKRLAKALNMATAEYARFVSALHKYRVHPGKPEL